MEGGTGSLCTSAIRLRATIWPSALLSRSAAVRSVTPCNRTSASAARLNTASATSISSSVKPRSVSRPLPTDQDLPRHIDGHGYALAFAGERHGQGIGGQAGTVEGDLLAPILAH